MQTEKPFFWNPEETLHSEAAPGAIFITTGLLLLGFSTYLMCEIFSDALQWTFRFYIRSVLSCESGDQDPFPPAVRLSLGLSSNLLAEIYQLGRWWAANVVFPSLSVAAVRGRSDLTGRQTARVSVKAKVFSLQLSDTLYYSTATPSSSVLEINPVFIAHVRPF